MSPGGMDPRPSLTVYGICFTYFLSTYELKMLIAIIPPWIGIMPHQGDQLRARLPIDYLVADIEV